MGKTEHYHNVAAKKLFATTRIRSNDWNGQKFFLTPAEKSKVLNDTAALHRETDRNRIVPVDWKIYNAGEIGIFIVNETLLLSNFRINCSVCLAFYMHPTRGPGPHSRCHYDVIWLQIHR